MADPVNPESGFDSGMTMEPTEEKREHNPGQERMMR
jgi:hypothetical protein